MDLELKAMIGAVHLFGVVATLRRLYQLPRETPDPIRIALADLEMREHLAHRQSFSAASVMTSRW